MDRINLNLNKYTMNKYNIPISKTKLGTRKFSDAHFLDFVKLLLFPVGILWQRRKKNVNSLNLQSTRLAVD